MPSRAGIPNKVTKTAKENIVAVFVRMGGTAAMAKWAKANETEFYRIYSRLLPHEVTGENGDPIKVQIDSTELARRAAFLLRKGTK